MCIINCMCMKKLWNLLDCLKNNKLLKLKHDNSNTYTYFEYIICINKTYICWSWNSCLWLWWSWSLSLSLSFIHLTLTLLTLTLTQTFTLTWKCWFLAHTLRGIDSQWNSQYSVYNYRKRNVKFFSLSLRIT